MPTLPPFLAPTFTRVGGLLKVLGFPGAGSEETMFDLSDMITATSAAAAAAAAAQTDATNALLIAKPARFAVYGDEMEYLSGTPGNTVVTTFPYNWITFTTTLNAQAYVNLELRPGTWTIKFLTLKRNDCSKLTVTLNASPVVTNLDLYSAVQDLEYIHTVTGVTVPDATTHELLFLAAAKNPSSSSHVMAIVKAWGWRTGA